MSDQAQIMSVTESKRPSYVTTSIDADNKIMPHSNIIKIRGLSNNVTVDHLREIFSVYGCLKRVSLPVDVHSVFLYHLDSKNFKSVTFLDKTRLTNIYLKLTASSS